MLQDPELSERIQLLTVLVVSRRTGEEELNIERRSFNFKELFKQASRNQGD